MSWSLPSHSTFDSDLAQGFPPLLCDMSITGQGPHELPKNPSIDGGRHTPHASRACDGCRARKFRCDGAKPTCNNCDFRNEACLWSQWVDKRHGRLSAENQVLRLQVAELRAMVSSAPVMDWLQHTNGRPDRKFIATYSIGNVVTFPVLDGEPSVPVMIIACIDRNRRSATLKASAEVCGSTVVLALKHMTVSPGRQQEQISREVNVWRSANHPRLQPLLGVLREDFDNAGDHLLASPWAENGNMLDYLRNTATACRTALTHQVAEALDYLHSTLGIVHGDVKCENVLINGQGNAQLTDFGLSTFTWKELDEATTATSLRIQYTTDFSAPELLTDSAFGGGRRRSKTVQTDVYAYGMLVLQAFTLRRPWYHLDNDVQLIMSVTTGARPERPTSGPGAASRGLDDALWALCLQCWDATPSERPTMRTIVESIPTSHPPICRADPCAFAEASVGPSFSAHHLPQTSPSNTSVACKAAPGSTPAVCATSPLDVPDRTSARPTETVSLKRRRSDSDASCDNDSKRVRLDV
ncbi:kinase-like protein [Exidia glandulosa HHB12029]|uniref:Kinase-like protein n=1 Tax=Exidia glandulosa HHB12029 TaxID=1314781 RepID=A0A165KB61_EXIGL|nr:kinase-like protein [Exidia glandulosa HHB12029]